MMTFSLCLLPLLACAALIGHVTALVSSAGPPIGRVRTPAMKEFLLSRKRRKDGKGRVKLQGLARI